MAKQKLTSWQAGSREEKNIRRGQGKIYPKDSPPVTYFLQPDLISYLPSSPSNAIMLSIHQVMNTFIWLSPHDLIFLEMPSQTTTVVYFTNLLGISQSNKVDNWPVQVSEMIHLIAFPKVDHQTIFSKSLLWEGLPVQTQLSAILWCFWGYVSEGERDCHFCLLENT
jgi:hypothetical protein